MSPPRYAATTRVPVLQTRNEIEKTLERYGADAFAYGSDGARDTIAFRMGGRQIRIGMTMPDRDDRQFTHSPSGVRSADAAQTVWEQARRQRWRALLLVIKAKLEAISSGITTLEDEFLANTILPDGQTVAQWLREDLALAYSEGGMPKRLMLEGPAQ